MVNALNLTEIDQEEALNITKFFIESRNNICFFGQKGTGKTHIAMQAIHEAGLKINYINLSVIERPDLAGYPNLQEAGDIVTFKSPVFLPTLLENNNPDTVILFDEVDKAPPEVTAPLLEILQFRKINGKPINAASCILTGNLANEGAYSNQVSTALLDRCAKYILSFNLEKWIDWAKANGVHDLVIGFLRSNPDFACGKVDDMCYASPSPRGWTLASEAIFKAKKIKIVDIETITHIVSGFVGYEAGFKFKTWYEHFRGFETYVHSLIETGSMLLNFAELAETEKIVFIISACFYAKQKTIEDSLKKKSLKYLENLTDFINSNNIEPEVQVMGLRNSFDVNLIINQKYKMYTCKPFFQLFNKLGEYI
jgi:hypothetical protein